MIAPQTMKDIAKRGLECNQQIELMLKDIWHEFEIIEPTLAKRLAELYGSAEFAALMIIGRFNDQPSVLEELSNKPLSKEDVDEFLVLLSTFVSQLKEGAMKPGGGEVSEYKFDDQGSLTHQANQALKQYESGLRTIFRKLQEVDSEVANAALEVWDDENDAAYNLATPVSSLAGKSPLEALENGDRQELLNLLFRLQHGIFT